MWPRPGGRTLRGDCRHDAPNDVITFARDTFETSPIDDANAATTVAYQSRLLQGARDHRDRGASDAEHLSQELLGQRELIARDTVEEKILTLQNRKREVIQATIGGEEEVAASLSWDEIQELLA